MHVEIGSLLGVVVGGTGHKPSLFCWKLECSFGNEGQVQVSARTDNYTDPNLSGMLPGRTDEGNKYNPSIQPSTYRQIIHTQMIKLDDPTQLHAL